MWNEESAGGKVILKVDFIVNNTAYSTWNTHWKFVAFIIVDTI